eukprot:m.32437 g.32437  ORF g.32437 m.32437 type:complete len:95 (-) comp10033_c0_seq1:143-427(-)
MFTAFGKLPVLQYLVQECGADVSDESDAGETSLGFACAHHKSDMVEWLLDNTDADPRHNLGQTAADHIRHSLKDQSVLEALQRWEARARLPLTK